MLTVSVSHFRQRLFHYLEQAAAGETIVIQRNQREVARLVAPTPPQNWRNKLKHPPQLLVAPEDLLQPLDPDLWKKYDPD